ncbi:tetratricopeptide repeat protein [Streptomyces sp. NPDC056462]|uniref:tetratricopeptide repeat protein n=1 Tax=Streptomyces sp. NPDC056462 TaxID=3345826 RepID=UPI0036B4F191
MNTDRITLIRFKTHDGRIGLGSGLLVNERTVLTAHHVAEGTDHRVECAAGPRSVVSVLRSGSSAVDLALFTLAEPVKGLGALAVARVDRTSVGVLKACTVGFPRWRRDNRHRRTAQVDGTIPTAEGLAYAAPSGETEGLLTLVGNREPGAPRITTGSLLDTEVGTGACSDSGSPWAGMSGAGVIWNETVIGVVRSHNVAAGQNSLTVTPLTALELLPPRLRKRFWAMLGVDDSAKLPVLTAASTGTVASVVNTLPRSVPDFTGRDTVLRDLLDAATGDGAACVAAIDGMGGVGKTELALHAAHRMAAHYVDAQLFIDLQGFSRDRSPVPASSALESLLVAVQIAPDQVPAGLEQRSALWRATLARRRALLILDNAISADQVTPLLPGNSECAVLITSRRRLIDLEGAKFVTVETLDEPSAVELLKRITAGTIPVADEDDEQMREVVRLCGYLPLAIRIAGARLRRRPQLGLSGLVTELTGAHGRLGALRSFERDVRAAFDVSYEALEPDARRLFRRLGMHPGQDATVMDAAELAELPRDTTERVLEELLGDNLVQELQSGRFSLHDLLREYARDRARRDEHPSERAAAVGRLFGRYAELVAAADRGLSPLSPRAPAVTGTPEAGGDPDLAVSTARLSPSGARQWLVAEHANIVACSQSAFESRSVHALKLTVAAAPLLLLGYADDAGALYETALGAARALGDRAAEATALLGLGEVGRFAGRVAAARDSLEAARALCVELEDAAGLARAFYGLGEIERTAGRFSASLQYHGAAHAVCCDAGDQPGQADALRGMGEVAQALGDLESARQHYGRSLSLSEEIGNFYAQAYAYLGLAEVEQGARDHAAARERFERAEAICRTIGNRRGLANARYGLAEVARATRDWDRARADYARTRAICAEIGNLRGQAGALLGLGSLEEAIGNGETAVAHYEDANDLCQQIAYRPGQATALSGIGKAALEGGDPARAIAVWEQARVLCSDMGLDRRVAELDEKIQEARQAYGGPPGASGP